jgi:hypothetical protein
MTFIRRAMLIFAAALVIGAVSAGPASASHLVPATADSMMNRMVNNYRQTISPAACATTRTNGTHAPPFSVASCLPPAFLPGTQAALGPGGFSFVNLFAVQDDPTTPAIDEGDITIEVHLKNVICIVASAGCPGGPGSPYDPHAAGSDVAARFRMRLDDHANCSPSGCGGPFTSAGTTIDFDFRAPVPCTGAAPPASCDVVTSVDAVVGSPAAIAGGSALNAQIFRIRVSDSGMNNTFGDGDDREFAQQGLVVH